MRGKGPAVTRNNDRCSYQKEVDWAKCHISLLRGIMEVDNDPEEERGIMWKVKDKRDTGNIWQWTRSFCIVFVRWLEYSHRGQTNTRLPMSLPSYVSLSIYTVYTYTVNALVYLDSLVYLMWAVAGWGPGEAVLSEDWLHVGRCGRVKREAHTRHDRRFRLCFCWMVLNPCWVVSFPLDSASCPQKQ